MIGNFLEQLRSMIFVAPVVLLAIISHECAHGLMSEKLGDPTPRNSGRLSLNPLKHLDLMGTICMLIFHIGWAKPVPINPLYYRDRKKGIIYVSLAGPITNFILAFISLFIQGLLIKVGSPDSIIIWVLCQFCYYSAVVNVGLGLFNLVPIPPLDGSKVVGELFGKAQEFYWRYENYLRIAMIILIFTGVLSRPLGILNNVIIQKMWRLICGILLLR